MGEALKIVIVGHVDHGKSTLIGRLLYDTDSLPAERIAEIKKVSQELGRQTEFAYLLDYLEEERRQGITIDITQIFFKSHKRQYVIIDAPGHVEFVKNMITGASQAEAAILIIGVKEGVQEQTRRHAYILSLLGLDQVIVVLNKMDLVNFEEKIFEEVKKQISGFLDSIGIRPDFYLPICAIKGDNIVKRSEEMGWYKGLSLLEALDTLRLRRSDCDKPLIFPVQDLYEIDGKKIAVGRIEAGVLETGTQIKIMPSGYVTRVRSVEKYMEDVKKAYASESIGIIWDDPVCLNRGDIICVPGEEPLLSNRFRASIFWMSKEDLIKGQELTIRCATQERSCEIEMIEKRINSSSLEVIQEDAEILKNLEVGKVIISVKKPIVITLFNDVAGLGRFVLARDKGVCAGGIISGMI